MASHNFSFIFVTDEFENCRKASAEAATTASLPVNGTACKPPRKFLDPVGVVSKLKKKMTYWLPAPIIPFTMRR
jgi:hypothetical protein